MADRPKDAGNGVLFVNSKKEKDLHPDYQGELELYGKKYWLSGWRKESRNGTKYLSIAVRPKDQVSAEDKADAQRPPSNGGSNMRSSKPAPQEEDEIPF
jgi:hypothetical protein